MAQITGGSISYGRTIQPKEYESKRADAKIDFSVGEGENHELIVSLAGTLAQAKVNEMLGLVPSPAPQQAEQPTRRPPGRPPKVQPPENKLPADPAAIDDGIPEALRREKPTAGAASSTPATTTAKTVGEAEATDLAAVEEWAGEASPTTDEMLLAAITRKNGEVQNPIAIRKLIGAYSKTNAAGIPAEKRTAFLAELDKVQKVPA